MRNYIGDNINAIRVHFGLSQEQLADLADVSQTTISSWECGQTTPRRSNIARLIAKLPELDFDDVFSGENGFARRVLKTNSARPKSLIPLYGSISAGKSVEMLPVKEYLDVSDMLKQAYPTAFFLKVNGESMNRVLPNGSLALIDPSQREVVDGNIYAVCVNGSEATIKRVRAIGSNLLLQPDSTDASFKEIVFEDNAESQERIEVIGRVVWFCLSPTAIL